MLIGCGSVLMILINVEKNPPSNWTFAKSNVEEAEFHVCNAIIKMYLYTGDVIFVLLLTFDCTMKLYI